MSEQNLSLWDRVWQTDPAHTKAVKLDGRMITSINPTYMVRQATEQWGPLGIGWGYEIVEERFDPGAPIIDENGKVLANMVMHTLLLKLWYTQDGERGEVEHFGHTPYVSRTKWGASTDMDAPKKSLTDALKKCLSMLGFSADIFLGLYDHPDYVEERRVEEDIKRSDNADDAVAEARQEFHEFISEQLRGYGLVPHLAGLNAFHRATLSKAQRRAATLNIDPEKVAKRLGDRYDDRKAELQSQRGNKLTPTVCTECGTYDEHGGMTCVACHKKMVPADETNEQHEGENK
jgi:hypothetical protein